MTIAKMDVMYIAVAVLSDGVEFTWPVLSEVEQVGC